MGNSKSQYLKNQYVNNQFTVREQRYDINLGKMDILFFNKYPQDLFIRITINPKEYDEYLDINKFIEKLSRTNESVSNFFFVEYNKLNNDLFDLIFEGGNQVDNEIEDI